MGSRDAIVRKRRPNLSAVDVYSSFLLPHFIHSLSDDDHKTHEDA